MKTPPAKYRRPFARYMRWLGGMIGVYFLMTGVLSIVVNPWRINNTPFSLDSLDESRDIEQTVRVGKAALANYGDWEVLMFGSSRIEQAIDPEHPAFGGRKAVNLGMSAAGLLESIPAAHYALDRNPDAKVILFGIDAGDLHDDFDSRQFTGFYQSPFSDNNISIERGINQLIGGRSLIDSIGTIQRHLSGDRPDRTPLGQWVRPNQPLNIHDYVENSFIKGFENPHKGWDVGSEKLRQQKADLLRGFMERARSEGIAMYLLIPPIHALKLVHPQTDTPDEMCWDADLRAMLNICEDANRIIAPGPPVQLWNFMTFNEFTTQKVPEPVDGIARIDAWSDLGHAHGVVGDAAVETIFGERKGDMAIGDRLTSETWEEVEARWISKHEAYCALRADNVEWWRSLTERFAGKTKSRSMVEEAH